MGLFRLPDLGKLTGVKLSLKGLKFAKPKLDAKVLAQLGLAALPGGGLANIGNMSLANLSTENLVNNLGLSKILGGDISKLGLEDLAREIGGAAGGGGSVQDLLIQTLMSGQQRPGAGGSVAGRPAPGAATTTPATPAAPKPVDYSKANTNKTLEGFIKLLLGNAAGSVRDYNDRGGLRGDILDQAIMDADPTNIAGEVLGQQAMIAGQAKKLANRRRIEAGMAGYDPTMAMAFGDEVINQSIDDGNAVMRDMYDPAKIAQRRRDQLGYLDPNVQLAELNAVFDAQDRMKDQKKTKGGTSMADTLFGLVAAGAPYLAGSGSGGSGSSGGGAGSGSSWTSDPAIGSGTWYGGQ